MNWNSVLDAPVPAKLAVILGIVYTLLCILFVVSPAEVLAGIDWNTKEGIYLSVFFNSVWAVILFLAAPKSKSLEGFIILGAFGVLGVVFDLVTPSEVRSSMIYWWMSDNLVLTRILTAIVGVPIGALIIYGAIPRMDKSMEEGGT